MKINVIHSITLFLTLLAVSCTKEGPEQADDAIRLAPTIDNAYHETKAEIFSETVFPTDGDFYVEAYLTDQNGAVKPYFSSAVDHRYIVNDKDQIDEWSFCDSPGQSPAWKDYYFPLDGTVDFFAYVPQDDYVTVDVSVNPPIFTATLPLDNQTDVKEFMYAYTPAQSKEDPDVSLSFEHPFAAVRFEVGQAHRNLTIRTMGFKNINHKGSCALEYDEESDRYLPKWSNTTTGDMTITVEKIIPGDINFGGPVGDTFIMLPQELQSATFFITYNWDNNDNIETNDDHSPEISMSNLHPEGGWEAGKIYTYSLDLGNSAEEILFNVNVEQWNHTYDYTFELE